MIEVANQDRFVTT